jgi:hypothetical protein
MKTCYHYLSRRQIVVVWNDGETRDSTNYPRSEAGERRANRKLAALQATGYTTVEAPKDWFTALIEQAQEARS